jgi:alanyl-tRNA synthetase
MLSSLIRQGFLSFFMENGHHIIASSSVVPQNDPSLLFTNAGMVQFKNVFTGLETTRHRKIATVQKCIRAGGKHNDLDQVGFTARHHTFFEMLGNFSFGDYFKEEAIRLAWTFLTKELGISSNKLLVTIYHSDEETKQLWKAIAGNILVIPISTADNFWSIGDTGPCGPCTEIFFDHGADVLGGMPGSEQENGDRFTEIWNIVFMQYERTATGEQINLQKQSIDTGMGLERISSVMQGVQDNYETDLFRPIIDQIKYISSTNFANTNSSYKVIADHIRSISFLIADGIMPSNEGRGYVLRRILRRAMRHGHMLGMKDPFLFKISENFVHLMQDIYPELTKAKTAIGTLVHAEEEKFLQTLERGLKILQHEARGISSGGVLGGNVAFKLYDTYGFPLDLTQDILKVDDISVDTDGFEKALEEQRNRAKWAGSGETKEDAVWHKLKDQLAPTIFVGYETTLASSKIMAILLDGEERQKISAADFFHSSTRAFIVTEATPFFAECGGQCGDTGIIETPTASFQVINTTKFCNTLVAHEGIVESGGFASGDPVLLRINEDRRRRIGANHTATHLLQAALRNILGEHVYQRGSFLNHERLRFDFSHNFAISTDNLLKIENLVNEWIERNMQVLQRKMPREEAVASGALALFGEKYEDSVRAICVGDLPQQSNVDAPGATNQVSGDDTDTQSQASAPSPFVVSFELCGGTHVGRTAEIGSFKIVSEASIGAGIRRIEAITGQNVLQYIQKTADIVSQISEKLKCSATEIVKKIEDLILELKRKNDEIIAAKHRAALHNVQKIQRPSAAVLLSITDDCDIYQLRSLSEIIIAQNPSDTIAIVVGKSDGDRVYAIVNVSLDLQEKYNASQLLKAMLIPLNGKGGGGVATAQGGGIGHAKITEAVRQICDVVD